MSYNYLSDGQRVINSFLSSYKTYNKTTLTEAQLFSKILNYEPEKFKNLLGSAFVNGMDKDSTRMMIAMDNLARKTVGGYPTTSSFFDAMRDANPTTFEIVTDALTESAKDVGAGIEKFSEFSLFLVKALPFIAVGFGVYWLYKNKDSLNLKGSK